MEQNTNKNIDHQVYGQDNPIGINDPNKLHLFEYCQLNIWIILSAYALFLFSQDNDPRPIVVSVLYVLSVSFFVAVIFKRKKLNRKSKQVALILSLLAFILSAVLSPKTSSQPTSQTKNNISNPKTEP